uniref:Uncharacterized protein n=1 Tax=Strigamia maritima TaxID=126957 RepID=T1JIA2_STRMM
MSLELSKRKRLLLQDRLVTPFTYQANQKNVTVGKPKKSNYLAAKPNTSMWRFRDSYTKSDFPIQIEFLPGCQKLAWKVEIERLDFFYYLPLFFEGIGEVVFPFDFLARQSVHDMLQHGGARVVPVLGQLIVPISKALRSKQTAAMASMLLTLQDLATCHPNVGPNLVPYFRQILPTFSMFKDRNLNLGDRIEYGQRKRLNVADLMQETLEILEKTGGPHAFINIKYMVPTYESAVHN